MGKGKAGRATRGADIDTCLEGIHHRFVSSAGINAKKIPLVQPPSQTCLKTELCKRRKSTIPMARHPVHWWNEKALGNWYFIGIMSQKVFDATVGPETPPRGWRNRHG